MFNGIISTLAMLITLGAFADDSQKKEDIAQKRMDEQIVYISSLADGKPPEYDSDKDKRTVEGEDNDNDGIRDAIEHLTYGILFVYKETTQEDYDQLLNLMMYIQPEDPPVPNSLSYSKIRCDYYALKDFIRNEADFDLVYWGVLDTSIRQTAHARSLIKKDMKDYERCPELIPPPPTLPPKPDLFKK